jgi:hypothetical protein
MTQSVSAMLGYIPGGSRTYNFDQKHAAGSIDSYIFEDLQKNGIAAAPRTTDWEFIRRVTLDLTGRIPKPDRVLAFVADSASDKRAKLIDELLNQPEWVDKWTMFFGDLYRNTDNKPSTGVRRYPQDATPSINGSANPCQRQAVQPDGDRTDFHRGGQQLG